MQLEIRHRTAYYYSSSVYSNVNELRLSPEENARQRPGDVLIRVEPDPSATPRAQRDIFGNLVHFFEVDQRHRSLIIESTSSVETISRPEWIEAAMATPFEDHEAFQSNDRLYEFLTDSTFVKKAPPIWREALDIVAEIPGAPTVGGFAEGLSQFIFKNCAYEENWLHNQTTAAEVQSEKRGTCQDFAHLLVAYCRALDLPARYVSGYLFDPGLESVPERIGAQQSHAWVEIYVPSIDAWVGIDPTNNKWVDDEYVSVAFGRDYFDVAPVKGSVNGGGKRRDLEVELSVRRIKE